MARELRGVPMMDVVELRNSDRSQTETLPIGGPRRRGRGTHSVLRGRMITLRHFVRFLYYTYQGPENGQDQSRQMKSGHKRRAPTESGRKKGAS